MHWYRVGSRKLLNFRFSRTQPHTNFTQTSPNTLMSGRQRFWNKMKTQSQCETENVESRAAGCKWPVFQPGAPFKPVDCGSAGGVVEFFHPFWAFIRVHRKDGLAHPGIAVLVVAEWLPTGSDDLSLRVNWWLYLARGWTFCLTMPHVCQNLGPDRLTAN